MPRVEADMGNADIMTAAPDGEYLAEVSAADYGQSKAKNWMVTLSYLLVDNPKFNGRTVRFDHAVVSGRDKNGKPVSTRTLYERLDACMVPYEHIAQSGGCGATTVGMNRVRKPDTGEIELQCSACNTALKGPVGFNTEDFLAKPVRVLLGHGEPNEETGEVFNTVERVMKR